MPPTPSKVVDPAVKVPTVEAPASTERVKRHPTLPKRKLVEQERMIIKRGRELWWRTR